MLATSATSTLRLRHPDAQFEFTLAAIMPSSISLPEALCEGGAHVWLWTHATLSVRSAVPSICSWKDRAGPDNLNAPAPASLYEAFPRLRHCPDSVVSSDSTCRTSITDPTPPS